MSTRGSGARPSASSPSTPARSTGARSAPAPRPPNSKPSSGGGGGGGGKKKKKKTKRAPPPRGSRPKNFRPSSARLLTREHPSPRYYSLFNRPSPSPSADRSRGHQHTGAWRNSPRRASSSARAPLLCELFRLGATPRHTRAALEANLAASSAPRPRRVRAGLRAYCGGCRSPCRLRSDQLTTRSSRR